MSRRVADYDYEVPDAAVAQVPAAERTDARLLFVRRGGEVAGEGRVPDLVAALGSGDLLVLNDAHVAPARLSGVRADTGGRVSLLLLAWDGRRASALLGTRGTPRAGEGVEVAGDLWRLTEVGPEGRVELVVERGRDVGDLLAQAGRMPVPPYIRRDPVDDSRDALDRERYQTTYARPAVGDTTRDTAGETTRDTAGDTTRGTSGDTAGDTTRDESRTGAPAGTALTSVAAPTAGLHLTPGLLDEIAAQGVTVRRLALAVGAGTFRPMRGETLDEHEMHAEDYHVPASLAEAYAETRARGGRVVAVGTTVVRALESAVSRDGRTLAAGPARTGLFITPGHRFVAVDALLTNFHQPRSTLLVLVSAFAGRTTVRAAYARALAAGFRLFSYGDAMFLW